VVPPEPKFDEWMQQGRWCSWVRDFEIAWYPEGQVVSRTPCSVNWALYTEEEIKERQGKNYKPGCVQVASPADALLYAALNEVVSPDRLLVLVEDYDGPTAMDLIEGACTSAHLSVEMANNCRILVQKWRSQNSK